MDIVFIIALREQSHNSSPLIYSKLERDTEPFVFKIASHHLHLICIRGGAEIEPRKLWLDRSMFNFVFISVSSKPYKIDSLKTFYKRISISG